jgi:hypothetical protein
LHDGLLSFAEENAVTPACKLSPLDSYPLSSFQLVDRLGSPLLGENGIAADGRSAPAEKQRKRNRTREYHQSSLSQ